MGHQGCLALGQDGQLFTPHLDQLLDVGHAGEGVTSGPGGSLAGQCLRGWLLTTLLGGIWVGHGEVGWRAEQAMKGRQR